MIRLYSGKIVACAELVGSSRVGAVMGASVFLPWKGLTRLGDSMATGFQNRPGIRDPILLAPLAAVLQHPERDTAVSKPARHVTSRLTSRRVPGKA